MSSYLEPIIRSTQRRLDELRHRMVSDLEREAFEQLPPRDFLGALRQPGISLIGEIKRSSPSAGQLKGDADPAELARAYRDGGARAISVLTEPEFFRGSFDDLSKAKEAAALPVLRKDFILHHFQVLESRAEGADAVLLIVAALGEAGLLADLAAAAEELHMAALIEVHDERELETAMEAEPKLIGINQRDLGTFGIRQDRAAAIRGGIPDGVLVVAESGISTRAEMAALESAGIDGVLVGEALMRAADPATKAAELLGR